jgi:hypothetical protein
MDNKKLWYIGVAVAIGLLLGLFTPLFELFSIGIPAISTPGHVQQAAGLGPGSAWNFEPMRLPIDKEFSVYKLYYVDVSGIVNQQLTVYVNNQVISTETIVQGGPFQVVDIGTRFKAFESPNLAGKVNQFLVKDATHNFNVLTGMQSIGDWTPAAGTPGDQTAIILLETETRNIECVPACRDALCVDGTLNLEPTCSLRQSCLYNVKIPDSSVCSPEKVIIQPIAPDEDVIRLPDQEQGLNITVPIITEEEKVIVDKEKEDTGDFIDVISKTISPTKDRSIGTFLIIVGLIAALMFAFRGLK